MKQALQDADYPALWIEYPDEDPRFSRLQSRVDVAQRMERVLADPLR